MERKIQSGGLEITDYCNLNCIHCYKGECEALQKHMPYDNIINFIEQFIKYDAQWIVISGGEPLLHPDFMKLIEYIGESHGSISFIITTNGYYVDDNYINLIRKYKNIRTQISVDGATKEIHERQHGKDTFDRLIHILDRMRDIPKSQKIIRMSISKINYRECVEIAKMSEYYNADVSYSTVVKVGNASKNWDSLEMSIAQQVYTHEILFQYSIQHPELNIIAPKGVLSCPFENPEYVFGLTIKTNGDVNICTCLDGVYVIGNAYHEKFEDFLNSERVKVLSNLVQERKAYLRENKCRNCPTLYKCSQGCIGRGLSEERSFILDDQCDLRKALQFKNLYFRMNGLRSKRG